jgi:hypothetical protein
VSGIRGAGLVVAAHDERLPETRMSCRGCRRSSASHPSSPRTTTTARSTANRTRDCENPGHLTASTKPGALYPPEDGRQSRSVGSAGLPARRQSRSAPHGCGAGQVAKREVAVAVSVTSTPFVGTSLEVWAGQLRRHVPSAGSARRGICCFTRSSRDRSRHSGLRASTAASSGNCSFADQHVLRASLGVDRRLERDLQRHKA